MIICDFCTAQTARPWCYPCRAFVAWELPADQNILGVPVVADSPDDWAACDACHALIEAGDWEALAQRSAADSLSTRLGLRDHALAMMRDLHAKFRAHRAGPARQEEA